MATADALHPSPEAAARCWAEAVRANRAQVERVREDVDTSDFYAPVAGLFRADPRRDDDPTLAALRGLARPGETWLDIGAGEEGERQGEAAPAPVAAEVALIAHVGYDIEEIAPFLDAMEASARRLCVCVMLERPPTRPFDELWPEVHGEPRASLPSLPEFLALLLARQRLFEVWFVDRSPQSFATVDDLVGLARRQLWTRPGSAKDEALRALLRERVVARAGRVAASWDPVRVGVVTWAPV